LITEFTILAHSIKTTDELNFLSLVGLDINAVPFFVDSVESLTVSLSLFLQLSLLSLVFELLLSLGTKLLINSKLISNTSIESRLKKTSLIL